MADPTDITRRVIMSFLEKTGVAARFPPRSPPQYVETKVRETIESWNLDIPKEKYEKSLVNGMHLGYAPFHHAPYGLQIALSLFTFCAMIFDDGVLVDPSAMRGFVSRFCDGEPQLAPILDRFVECASNLRRFLHEYGANTVHSALLMYANEELWYTQRANKLVLRPDAGGYIEYSRYKSGVAEPYAFGIWPRDICDNTEDYIQAIPEVLNFINYLNDLFSFYKESLDKEQENYVNQYAQIRNKTVEDVVDDILSKTLASMEKVRCILGEGKAREAWESFASGYTHFLLYCPRYRLSEIVPEYF